MKITATTDPESDLEAAQRLKLELLRQEIRKGLDDLGRGEVVSAAKAFADVEDAIKAG